MTRAGWLILAFSLSAAVAVGAFLAPRSLPESFISEKEKKERLAALHNFMESSRNDLVPEERVTTRMWGKNLRAGQVTFADSLAAFWMKKNNLLMACDALQQRALQTRRPYDFEKAFDMYHRALEVSEDEKQSLLLTALVEFAEKALEHDSLMPSAHIALAVSEVYESGAPMKGISRLRRVLERDPSNPKALVQMGHFSVMSGQLDKALERYRAAWNARPADASIAFYMADTYARSGEEDSARIWLIKVNALEADESARVSIQDYFDKNFNITLQ